MPCKMARSPSDRKVYIGDLSRDVRRKELEDICGEYGRVRDCWVARNPPGFAFVEFDDARDAADTVRELNGRRICGRKVHAKLYTEKLTGRGGGRPNNSDEKCYECRNSGHIARDCRFRQQRQRRERSYSRDRSPAYRRDRTRSRSRSVKKRYSRSASEDRSNRRSRGSGDRYRRRETPPRRRTPSKSPPRYSRSRHSERRSTSPAQRRPFRPRSPDNKDYHKARKESSRSRSSSRGRRSRSINSKHRRSESPAPNRAHTPDNKQRAITPATRNWN